MKCRVVSPPVGGGGGGRFPTSNRNPEDILKLKPSLKAAKAGSRQF